jgi:hypothetical protein
VSDANIRDLNTTLQLRFLQALMRPSWRKLGFMVAAGEQWGWVGRITGGHLRFGHYVLEGIENVKSENTFLFLFFIFNNTCIRKRTKYNPFKGERKQKAVHYHYK